MDYMSNFPCPNREDAVEMIAAKIWCKLLNSKISATSTFVNYLANKHVDEFYDNTQERCSLTGWYMYESVQIEKNILNEIYEFKKTQLHILAKIRVIGKFMTIYNYVLEKRYCPGGAGMIEARTEFNEKILQH